MYHQRDLVPFDGGACVIIGCSPHSRYYVAARSYRGSDGSPGCISLSQLIVASEFGSRYIDTCHTVKVKETLECRPEVSLSGYDEDILYVLKNYLNSHYPNGIRTDLRPIYRIQMILIKQSREDCSLTSEIPLFWVFIYHDYAGYKKYLYKQWKEQPDQFDQYLLKDPSHYLWYEGDIPPTLSI